jgi:hypothetical protein
MKRLRLLFIAGLLIVCGATPAVALAVYQGGRYIGPFTGGMDGVVAGVRVDSFVPLSGSCLVSSTLVYDATASRQLELATGKCNGASIDTTCVPNYDSVGETWTGGTNYVCYPGPTVGVGVTVGYWVYRTGSSSTQYLGLFNSVHQPGWDLTGFSSPSTHEQGYQWSELTAGSTCSGWSGSTQHSSWERYSIPTASWTVISSSSIINTGCWSVGGLSGGNFSVTH